MKDMMSHKGYYGSIHYSDEDQIFCNRSRGAEKNFIGGHFFRNKFIGFVYGLMGNITLGPGAVSYLTESIHGAGSPRAQKIMTTRLADIESAKSCAYKLCGIRM